MRASFAQALFRALYSERAEEQKSLRTLLHWCYSRLHERRRLLRKLMGNHLHVFSVSGGSAGNSAGVSTVLQVLACVVRGFAEPLDDAARGLFDHLLLELHTPNGTHARCCDRRRSPPPPPPHPMLLPRE